MPLPAIRNASGMLAGVNPHQNSQLYMAELTGMGDLGKVCASRIWRGIPDQRAVRRSVQGGHEPRHG
jgi:hypothetical protein